MVHTWSHEYTILICVLHERLDENGQATLVPTSLNLCQDGLVLQQPL